jgi:thiol:disulfide interchange protein DsbD
MEFQIRRLVGLSSDGEYFQRPNYDENIQQALEKLGRSGVPTYVLYAPGKNPTLLPEALMPGTVLDAVNSLPRGATQSVSASSNLK